MIKRWFVIKLREERNLSRYDLANEINTSASVIWEIENNPSYNATLKTIKRLSDFFGVNYFDLLISSSEISKNL